MPDDRIPPASQAPLPPGIVDRLLQTARDARGLALDHLELAAMEAQRAAGGLVRILCGAIVISVLAVTAWMALVAGGAIWATRAGLSLPAALLLAALANLAIAAALAFWIRGRLPELLFSATLRQLRQTAGEEEWRDENPQ